MNRLFVVTTVAGLILAAIAGCIGEEKSQEDTTDEEPGFLGGFSNTAVFAGDYRMEESSYVSGRVLQDGLYEMLPGEVVYLKSEQLDGTDIQIGIIKPNVPQGVKIPVIADAGPYFTPMPDNKVFQERIGRWAENFVPHGHAFALIPIRGSANSGGGSDLCGPQEAADLNQAVTWLGQQEWCNGNVGMIGKSYDGSTPWEVAATGNPHLKTIVPISGISDMFTLLFKNGTESRAPVVFHTLYYLYGFANNNPDNGRSAKNTAEGIADVSFPVGATMSVYSTLTGERDPLGYWAARNYRPDLEKNYKGSILLVHGLQDWNVDPHNAYPWINTLEDKGLAVKHMLGQWGHHHPDSMEIEGTEHMRWDWQEILLHWFDYWLKGNESVDLGPRAQVEDSSGRWRNEETWPPKDTASVTFYLTVDGKLSTDPSGDSGEASMSILGSSESPVFISEPIDNGLRFAGSPAINLTVTPQMSGGQITALLYSTADGSSMQRVGCGQVDLGFNGGEKRQLVIPGQEMQVTLMLQPLDVVIAPGSCLVLKFTQNGYEDHLNLAPLPVTLAIGGNCSRITLDTFERQDDVFFTPPE
ncbi:MAG: hypothetical protein CVT48_02390 [Thermoplasmata archaeon HGW-Thermoplasmata-1]|nr:MAG: hypothetical protein CVT48_02390 [Thermoplasmata archaeon HGW-Thermoplasmata-1]